MDLLRFKLVDNTPADANPMLLFSSGGLASRKIKNVKHRDMDLIVTKEQGDGSLSHIFDPSEIWFETRESEQTLIIRLVTQERTDNELPRFQFHRLESTDLRFIKNVKHHISGGGSVNRSRDEASPDKTHMIEITFEFPGEDPPHSMYMNVHIWDHDGASGSKVKKCDPLVGNDPP
jgi:hypothetical protein